MEYFVPGYIFLSIFYYFTSRKESQYKLTASIVISYIIKALCSCIHKKILINRTFSWNVRIFILVACAIFFAIFLIYFSESEYIKKIYKKINFKTTHEDIWKSVIDYKNGTTLRIYSKNTIYIGVLDKHEEKGNDSWFVITKYIIKDNGEEFDSTKLPFDAKLAINIKDIDRIELYYKK